MKFNDWLWLKLVYLSNLSLYHLHKSSSQGVIVDDTHPQIETYYRISRSSIASHSMQSESVLLDSLQKTSATREAIAANDLGCQSK